METETRAAEKEKEVSEINVFTLDPNGYKTHWKITSDTTDAQLAELMKREITLTKWLKEKEYQPDEMGRGHTPAPATPTNGATAPAPGGAASWVVNADGSRSCSVHGVGEFVPPGTSKRTGKPYTGFWKCRIDGCKPTGEN